MAADHDRWIDAIADHETYELEAPLHVAERIGALAVTGDHAGIERWKEIAVRLDQIMRGSLQ